MVFGLLTTHFGNKTDPVTHYITNNRLKDFSNYRLKGTEGKGRRKNKVESTLNRNLSHTSLLIYNIKLVSKIYNTFR